MAVVAGVVFVAVRGLLALFPALTVAFPIKTYLFPSYRSAFLAMPEAGAFFSNGGGLRHGECGSGRVSDRVRNSGAED